MLCGFGLIWVNWQHSMTDLELNARLAHIIYPERERIDRFLTNSGINYCTNWNDLMPLVEKHCLKMESFNRGKHQLVRLVAIDNSFSEVVRATSLIRATAECLLKVLENKNES